MSESIALEFAILDIRGPDVCYSIMSLVHSNNQGSIDAQSDEINRAKSSRNLGDSEDTVFAPPSAPAVPPEPIAWGVDTRVCVEYVSGVLKSQFDWWWVRERAKSLLLDPAVINLPNCWYGRECRTQAHNPSHAARYNMEI